MSRSAIRSAAVNYLQGISGITNLYRDAPWELLGDNWAQAATGLPGTPAFIHLNRSKETRQTITLGSTKSKFYDVSLLLLYQYIIPAAPTDKVSWVDGLDTLLDAVEAKLRADPTMGAPGVVWSSTEDEDGITVTSDLPVVTSGVVHAWNRVDWKVREILAA